jgi:acetyl-CoA carboxylase biotin carboxylase subunit
MKMFEKVLIANRGEIAVRVMRTCREMGIATVAVHSEVDAKAQHVLAADEAVLVGGDEPGESYLNQEKIIGAAVSTGAQAIHPGYGFLAENGSFARLCKDRGIEFIGPPGEVLEAAGDKIGARKTAHAAGVPVIPGNMEAGGEVSDLIRKAEEVGYPVMVKAAAGGGGKGMRLVARREDLVEALQRAESEARSAFGDGSLYIEKCITDPRHVEVQVLADEHGSVLHLYERECSIQRRHQKIIEEAPSPAVDVFLRKRLTEAATAVARAVGYRGAGTVEFLLEPDGSFYFMEVNARLQVEHPVTELILGLDLVEQQLRIAAGEKIALRQEDVKLRGHAVECRIYAEDPQADFLPSPGRIQLLKAPAGPGIRFDSGVESGDTVPVDYDPILGKLVAWGPDRERAVRRMARALSEMAILGVKTPIGFLLEIVESEAFSKGETSTGFLRRHFQNWRPRPDRVKTALLGWLVAELEGDAAPEQAASAAKTAAAYDPWARLGYWRMGGG